MSEQLALAAPEKPSSPETDVTRDELNESIDSLDSAVMGPEGSITRDEVDSSIDSLDSAVEPLKSPEEQFARVRLESLKELRISVTEDHVIPTLNRLGRGLDRARNFQDKASKKVFLLDQRWAAKERKAMRIEARLASTGENSMLHRHLIKKQGKMRRKAGEIKFKLDRNNGGASARQETRAGIEGGRKKSLILRRDMLRIEKQVAKEKQHRSDVENQLESATESKREQLRAEVVSWDQNTIGKFRQKLLKKSIESFRVMQ